MDGLASEKIFLGICVVLANLENGILRGPMERINIRSKKPLNETFFMKYLMIFSLFWIYTRNTVTAILFMCVFILIEILIPGSPEEEPAGYCEACGRSFEKSEMEIAHKHNSEPSNMTKPWTKVLPLAF